MGGKVAGGNLASIFGSGGSSVKIDTPQFNIKYWSDLMADIEINISQSILLFFEIDTFPTFRILKSIFSPVLFNVVICDTD